MPARCSTESAECLAASSTLTASQNVRRAARFDHTSSASSVRALASSRRSFPASRWSERACVKTATTTPDRAASSEPNTSETPICPMMIPFSSPDDSVPRLTLSQIPGARLFYTSRRENGSSYAGEPVARGTFEHWRAEKRAGSGERRLRHLQHEMRTALRSIPHCVVDLRPRPDVLLGLAHRWEPREGGLWLQPARWPAKGHRGNPHRPPPPERTLSTAQHEQVRALVRAGRSLRALAAEFGVSRGAIWRLMHADDVAVDADEDAPRGGDA